MVEYLHVINPFTNSREDLIVEDSDRSRTLREFVSSKYEGMPLDDTEWHLVDPSTQETVDHKTVGEYLANISKVWLSLGSEAIKGGY
ncbi:MAG: hypothetical protein ACTSUF_10640 [Candidatus Heimdallarchaeaceae archaeon]